MNRQIEVRYVSPEIKMFEFCSLIESTNNFAYRWESGFNNRCDGSAYC